MLRVLGLHTLRAEGEDMHDGEVMTRQVELASPDDTLQKAASRIAEQDTGVLQWWQRSVIYQVYPLSFQDTDGDGRGDLPGIIARLDHLSWLGVGAVWLGPVYPSPMADFGYDIADFTDVDPAFGTLDDLDRLIDGLHGRGIKLILDFVPNHTSSTHPWFLESRSARSSPKRDWYVWHDPGPDGGPPTNWLSRFGGSAWEFDARTGQYYYHAFLKDQPDLNWRNPQVRHAMADVLRFWMRRGVDGFRADAAAVLIEDDRLRDEPPNPEFTEDRPPPERLRHVFTDCRPETLDHLTELREVLDEFPDRVLLGEVDTSPDCIADFYGGDRPRLHLPLNYCLLDTAWDACSIEHAIRSYLDTLPPDAWPCWLLGSHDKPRIAGRIGQAQARVGAMLLLTLPGTPIIYAGDEIGIGDVPIRPEQVRDPFERQVPDYGLNRDPSRTPMCWDPSPTAGFTSGKPWLPVGGDAERCNAEVQRADERSLLTLYRRLIALRGVNPALLAGSYEPVCARGSVLTYWRSLGDLRMFVALNLGGASEEVAFVGEGKVRLSTHLDRQSEWMHRTVCLRAHEGVIVEAGE
jgi:alpha-glucosidase